MLHFFRHIRQNLLNENKTLKYLKYAFGEFVLIVVGILIALQIQNWNEERMVSKEEAIILEGLEREFTHYLEELDKERENLYAPSISGMENILKAIEKGRWEGNKSEFDQAFFWVLLTPITNWQGGVLDSTIQSGRLDLIRDGGLREKLSNWKVNFGDLQEMQQKDRSFLSNHVFPYLIPLGFPLSGVVTSPNVRFQLEDWPVKKKPVFSKPETEKMLLTDESFRSLIELRYWGLLITERRHQFVLGQAQDILEHIKGLRNR